MFERHSLHARRSIYFALQEARDLGSTRIDTVHLLLGILREDANVAALVGTGALATIRKELEQVAPPKAGVASTSGDLPLSKESHRALTLGAKEADALQHQVVDTPHLVLGLLRMEDCTAGKLLREFGMDYDRFRETLRGKPMEEPRPFRTRERPIERAAPWNEAPSIPPAAPRLKPSIRALENLLDNTVAHIHAYSVPYGEERLKRMPPTDKPWTRKEAFGHLIDWAVAHQQWLARALIEPKLTAAGYPGEAEVASQRYAEFSWWETVDLWVSLNRLLVHVLLRVPEDKLEVRCKIGIADPVSLAELVKRYVEHCEDIVGQILAHL